MKHSILSVVGILLSTTAYADGTPAAPQSPVSGEVTISFAETAGNNYGASMLAEVNVDAGEAALVDLNFTATDGNALTLKNWTVGTDVAGVSVAIGDDNGIMPTAEKTAYNTLATPAMTESVSVSAMGATVAMGWTSWGTDLSDISNIQGAYDLEVVGVGVKTAVDYNRASKNTVLGAEVSGIDMGILSLGGATTYDTDAKFFAFETLATVGGLTAYLNGDEDDTTQNLGGEYSIAVGGAEFTAGANYDLNTEDLSPSASLSFAF